MRFTEILSEETTPYDEPKSDDIGLMTVKEFLYYRNPRGKSHPNEVYNTTLKSMNRPDRMREVTINRMSELSNKMMTIQISGKGINPVHKIVLSDDKPIAIMIDDVLYYTINFPVKQLIPFSYRDQWGDIIELKPSTIKPIKYIKPYIDKINNIGGKNVEYYPHVIRKLLIDDEQLTIRTTKPLPYPHNSGQNVVILNKDDLIVASASDEWGATLLQVVEEYRGKNLGTILGKYWYQMNPDFSSGGFSPQGQRNAIRIWEDRVRTFLKNGWYDKFIKNKELTIEKVKDILSGLPERKKQRQANTPDNRKPEPLIYSDLDNEFIIYDKKFYEDRDEKYIYAHGFLRGSGNKIYIYDMNYEDSFRTIATYVMFQIAYDNKEQLTITTPPSDHLVLDDIDGIKVDGDVAYLTEPALNLKKYANIEKQYRVKHDQYDEAYNTLQELANSKWN